MPNTTADFLASMGILGPTNAALEMADDPSGAFKVQDSPLGGKWLHLRIEAVAVESAVARVRGVAETTPHGRYQLYLTIGAAFSWGDVLPGIRRVIADAMELAEFEALQAEVKA